MLNKKTFVAGTEKLEEEFGSKGFKMTKEKASQWYSYMDRMSDKEFDKRIDYVLKNCSFAPCMADMFKDDIQESKINAAAYEPFKFD